MAYLVRVKNMKKNNKFIVGLLSVLLATTSITQNAEPLDWKMGIGGIGIGLGIVTFIHGSAMKEIIEDTLKNKNLNTKEKKQLKYDLNWYKKCMYLGAAIGVVSICITAWGAYCFDYNEELGRELVKNFEEKNDTKVTEENGNVTFEFDNGTIKVVPLESADNVRQLFRLGAIALGGIDNYLRSLPPYFPKEAKKLFRRLNDNVEITKSEKIFLLCIVDEITKEQQPAYRFDFHQPPTGRNRYFAENFNLDDALS